MTWKIESTLTSAGLLRDLFRCSGGGSTAGRFRTDIGGDGDGHNMCGMIGFSTHATNLGFEGRGIEQFDLEELKGAGYATGYRDGREDGDDDVED